LTPFLPPRDGTSSYSQFCRIALSATPGLLSGKPDGVPCSLASFEKSISVYLIALGKVRDKNEKEFILNELGEVYFKAGFLKKASEVFEKVLELSPRNVLALRFLTMIDEKLKNYKEALYALNSLEELGVNVKDQKAYIKAISTLDDRNLSFNEKVEILSRLSQNFELLRRMILALFIRHNENLENF